MGKDQTRAKNKATKHTLNGPSIYINTHIER